MSLRRARHGHRRPRDPAVALINIVFLLLLFFLVAGTLGPSAAPDLTLVRTEGLGPAAPAAALVVHADGRMTWNGAPVATAAALLADLPAEARDPLRVIPDRALPAALLVTLGRDLQAAGAGRIVIVTEQALR